MYMFMSMSYAQTHTTASGSVSNLPVFYSGLWKVLITLDFQSIG